MLIPLSDAKGLTDEGIATLIGRCPNLRKVSLPGTSELGNASLLSFLTSCPSLKHLEISSGSYGSSNLSPTGFTQIEQNPDWAPNLKKLRLTDPKKTRGCRARLKAMSKTRPELLIDLVHTSEEKHQGKKHQGKKHQGSWDLITKFETWQDGKPARKPKKRYTYGRRW
jgi:hypothetical protein